MKRRPASRRAVPWAGRNTHSAGREPGMKLLQDLLTGRREIEPAALHLRELPVCLAEPRGRFDWAGFHQYLSHLQVAVAQVLLPLDVARVTRRQPLFDRQRISVRLQRPRKVPLLALHIAGSRRKVVSLRLCGYELVLKKENPRECSPGVRGPVPPQGGVL